MHLLPSILICLLFLTGCTTVTIYPENGNGPIVERYGLSLMLRVDGSNALTYIRKRGAGIVPGTMGSLTLGYESEELVLVPKTTGCRMVLIVDSDKQDLVEGIRHFLKDVSHACVTSIGE